MNKNQPESTDADPHFGTDEEMLQWCQRVGITPSKDEDGNYDWPAAWQEYQLRPEES